MALDAHFQRMAYHVSVSTRVNELPRQNNRWAALHFVRLLGTYAIGAAVGALVVVLWSAFTFFPEDVWKIVAGLAAVLPAMIMMFHDWRRRRQTHHHSMLIDIDR